MTPRLKRNIAMWISGGVNRAFDVGYISYIIVRKWSASALAKCWLVFSSSKIKLQHKNYNM